MANYVSSNRESGELLTSWDIRLTSQESYACMAVGGITAVATVVAIGVINAPVLILSGLAGTAVWFCSTQIYKSAIAIYKNGVNGNEWLIAASLICTLVESLHLLAGTPPLTLTNFVWGTLIGSSVSGFFGSITYDILATASNISSLVKKEMKWS